jgi:hypothetical protein
MSNQHFSISTMMKWKDNGNGTSLFCIISCFHYIVSIIFLYLIHTHFFHYLHRRGFNITFSNILLEEILTKCIASPPSYVPTLFNYFYLLLSCIDCEFILNMLTKIMTKLNSSNYFHLLGVANEPTKMTRFSLSVINLLKAG